MAETIVEENEPKPSDEASELDPYDISIQALRPPTKNLISALLNPPKIFLSDSGLPRDWHGLAQLVGIEGEHMPHIESRDASNKILSLWQQRDVEGATIKKLLSHLEKIDRYDIVDDVTPLLDEDIKLFNQNSKACVPVDMEYVDDYILTRDDLERAKAGLAPQQYNAFVLFSEEDITFVTELVEKLENMYNLKLCVKNRDLVFGGFEHESIIKLIAERCDKLIAVVSPSFLESSSNKFFCSFAQSLGLEKRQRKIIPCLCTKCEYIPPELKIYFMLDYSRQTGLAGNFWERLKDSIKTININNPGQQQNIYRSASQKIPAITHVDDINPISQVENNNLKPKKAGVKFNSMINLSYDLENDIVHDENLNPSSSINSLSIPTIEDKKNKTISSWFKKFVPHKNSKCSDVISEVPERHKRSFFSRSIKRKAALAN